MTKELLKNILSEIFDKEDMTSNRIRDDIMSLIMTKYPEYCKQCVKELKKFCVGNIETYNSDFSKLKDYYLSEINFYKDNACKANYFNEKEISYCIEKIKKAEIDNSNMINNEIKFIKECDEMLKTN